jgi:hypothetical protein
MTYHSKNVHNIKDLAASILSEMFNCKKDQILNMKSRKHNIIQAKRFLIYYLNKALNVKHNAMNKYIKNIDHATSIHHVKKLDNFLDFDKETKRDYTIFVNHLENNTSIENIDLLISELKYLRMKSEILLDKFEKIELDAEKLRKHNI